MIDLPNIVSESILNTDSVESTVDNYAMYPWLKYLKDIIDGKPAGDKVDKILTDIRTSLNPYSTNYGRACRLHKQNLNGCVVQLHKMNGFWMLTIARNDLRYPRIIMFLIGRTLAEVHANQAAPGYFKSLSRQSYENGIYFPPIELFNIIKSMLPSEYQRVVEGILDADSINKTLDVYEKYPFILTLQDVADDSVGIPELDEFLNQIRTSLKKYSYNYSKSRNLYKNPQNCCVVKIHKTRRTWVMRIVRKDLDRQVYFHLSRIQSHVFAGKIDTTFFDNFSKQDYEEGVFFPPTELFDVVFDIVKKYCPSLVYECDVCATPANTMGMGNPMAPESDVVGSGDIPNAGNSKRKKKMKKLKDVLEGILDADSIQTPVDEMYKVLKLIEKLAKGKSRTELYSALKKIQDIAEPHATKIVPQDYFGGKLCRLVIRKGSPVLGEGIIIALISGTKKHCIRVCWDDEYNVYTNITLHYKPANQQTEKPYLYLPSELFDLVKNKLKIK